MTPVGPVGAGAAAGYAPPPGPGVAPPFAAPPLDRSRRGLWIGLIVGGIGFVLCCVGGLFGFGLLTVAGNDQIQLQVKQTVEQFVDAVHDGNYPLAHEQLCESKAVQVSQSGLQSEFGQETLIRAAIGQPRVSARQATVDVELQYANSSPRTYAFTLVPEGTEWKICNWQ
jgi:hypothetical protein